MPPFLNETDAAKSGYVIIHEPESQRFALYHADGDATSASRALIGEAHYSLVGETAIDFDHTVVSPEYRGTGLSGLLARHAITSETTRGKRILASCWFIEGYLAKHPELRAESPLT